MTPDSPPPRYTHDCARCKFLGPHGDFDLYFCPGPNTTVIARRGGEGNYKSGLIFGRNGLDPELAEAYQRAVLFGLLTE